MTTSIVPHSDVAEAIAVPSGTSDWKPFLPEPPRVESSVFDSRTAGLSVRPGILAAFAAMVLLSILTGEGRSALWTVIALSTVITFRLAARPDEKEIRSAERRITADLAAGHDCVQYYVDFLNERGLSGLRDVMAQGGISRTKQYEHPYYTHQPRSGALASEDMRILPKRSAAAWRQYVARRDEIRWEAEQLVLIRRWASWSARPAAECLRQWVDQHQHRSPAMAAFVNSLIPVAMESDSRIAEEARREREQQRLLKAQREREAQEEVARQRLREEQIREYLRQQASLNHYYRTCAEDTARQKHIQELEVATSRLKVLAEAREDLLSRAEHRQAGYVRAEELRWQDAIDAFKKEHNL